MNDAGQAGAFSMGLRRRRSQEAPDIRVVFVPRGNGLLIAALAIVIIAGSAWGLLGSIPTKAHGQGIIVRHQQRIAAVQALLSGRVTRIAVDELASVEAGQVVAIVEPTLLLKELELARERAEAMNADLAELLRRQQDNLEVRDEATARELESLQAALENTQNQAESLGAFLRDEEALLNKGLARRPIVIDHRIRYQDALNQIQDLKSRIASTKSDQIDYQIEARERFDERRRAVEDQQRRVRDLETRQAEASFLRAPAAGIVQEIRVGIGDVVEGKDVLVTVATGGPGFEALAFLRPDQARRVTVGMPAHVIPTTVKKEEFGTMRGTVASVSEDPASPDEILALLRNPKLAETFAEAGSPYISRVALVADPAVPSGFAWWSGGGPPFSISVGTLAAVEIIVREQPPITWVIPALREALNL